MNHIIYLISGAITFLIIFIIAIITAIATGFLYEALITFINGYTSLKLDKEKVSKRIKQFVYVVMCMWVFYMLGSDVINLLF